MIWRMHAPRATTARSSARTRTAALASCAMPTSRMPSRCRGAIRVPRPTEPARDARATHARVAQPRPQPEASRDEQLAPLFSADVAQGFRARWDATQIGFVDDPRQAVQQADELVAQVMKSLAQSFADERRQLEAQMKETASTENLRVALQRYRSFFQRLLSL